MNGENGQTPWLSSTRVAVAVKRQFHHIQGPCGWQYRNEDQMQATLIKYSLVEGQARQHAVQSRKETR